MMIYRRTTVSFVLLVAAQIAGTLNLFAGIEVVGLKCEYSVDPMGIDMENPRLYWRLESHENNQFQTAWQVLVASSVESLKSDQGNLWDSGKVASDQTTHVRYNGKPLQSTQQVFWKVRS